MRLATACVAGEYRLFVEAGGSLVDVAAANPELAQLRDVGALLRAGDSALATVADLSGGAAGGTSIDDLELAPPVLVPSKLICAGLNYTKHALEGGEGVPVRPILFAKFQNTLVGSGQPIVHPRITKSLDYEGELGVVIGRRVTSVDVVDAGAAVAGYLVANDVSARDIQESDPANQWLRGKSLDTFAPQGPFFVTADEVADWRTLQLRTWVNGELRQDETCGDMVFGVEQLISYASQDLTLEPGDVILTGTPSGVGYSFDPPRWLKPGDLVEVEISGLGRLRSPVVDRPEGQRSS